MNLKLKTLLAVSGAVLLSVPATFAQGHGFGGGGRASAGARPSFAARPASRPLVNNALNGSRTYRSGNYGRGSYSRGGYGHRYGHGYGRYYYLGGVPYLFPFYGYGYGYGGFYGDGFYGDSFYGGYGDGGYGDAGYNGYGYNGAQGGNGANAPYEGRITNNRSGQNGSARNGDQNEGTGPSLPEAVQRQLSKRGYYKGSVDGQFGPASRDALKRFQKSQGMKATGNIDEDSLDALGFTDKRQ